MSTSAAEIAYRMGQMMVEQAEKGASEEFNAGFGEAIIQLLTWLESNSKGKAE